MKRSLICPVIIFLCNLSLSAQTVDIPDGVKYAYASDKVNEKAKALITKEITKPSYKLYKKLLFVGPNLWNRYKSIPELQEIVGNALFKVPTYDEKGKLIKMDTLQGKLIQDEKEFRLLWNQVVKDLAGKEFVLRKLTHDELQYYWINIPFDIEEPIYIVEANNIKLLVDVSKDDKLEWLDEVK
jgi:hypothetical protein